MLSATHAAFSTALYLGGAAVFEYPTDPVSWVLAILFSFMPDIDLPTSKVGRPLFYTGATPLHFAAQFDRKDVAKLLLANKANVNIKANNGYTPLHVAAGKGYTDVAKMLLANKADINAKENKGEVPLGWAIRFGHKEMVELLIANKADLNIRDRSGETFLHIAAARGQKAMVELLIANKAEINAKDNAGHRPLAWAVNQRHNDIANILRQHGGKE
jgi:ankyrin repeat protein